MDDQDYQEMDNENNNVSDSGGDNGVPSEVLQSVSDESHVDDEERLATPMPDLSKLTQQIKSDLMDVHNTAIQNLSKQFQAHARETGQRLANAYEEKGRAYLSRSQTGTALFRTGHAISNAYFEEQVAKRGANPP